MVRPDQAKFRRADMREAHVETNRLIALRKKTLGVKDAAAQNGVSGIFDDKFALIRNKLSASGHRQVVRSDKT